MLINFIYSGLRANCESKLRKSRMSMLYNDFILYFRKELKLLELLTNICNENIFTLCDDIFINCLCEMKKNGCFN
jgi:hypothetical protein